MGYTRIQGALANLGHDVGRGTIANVLSEHGIDPAPERGKRTSWSTFLKAHWAALRRRSRAVKIAGITSRPDEAWMMQMVRNLTDAEEPFLRHMRFLIMDRDTKIAGFHLRSSERTLRGEVEVLEGRPIAEPGGSDAIGGFCAVAGNRLRLAPTD